MLLSTCTPIGSLLPALSSSLMTGTLGSASFHQCIRACATRPLTGTKTPPNTVPVKQGAATSGHREHHRTLSQAGVGNVYPTLSPQQLDAMRQRRLTSNCAPSQLQYREPAAHQAKHIMMCSGSSCKSACKPCGSTGPSNGERCWEYLSHRLAELNQLCSQDDEQQPILCSKLNCLQAQNLLPALAATLPCHGPIAVVYPEGVWYDRLTPLVLERIIEEHLLAGHTVSAHVMIGSRAPDHDPHVLPALDITRRANTDGHWACDYAY